MNNNSQQALLDKAIDKNYGTMVTGIDIVVWDKGKEGTYWSDYQSKYPNAAEVESSEASRFKVLRFSNSKLITKTVFLGLCIKF